MNKTTDYSLINEIVSKDEKGNTTKLKLQKRISEIEKSEWYTLSWRTNLNGISANRRFYFTNNEAWSISPIIAYEMLTKAGHRGMLDERYYDTRDVNYIHKKEDNIDKDEIILKDETWYNEPTIIVANESTSLWRKAMIIDKNQNNLTFRSTTKNKDYKPSKIINNMSTWVLDNAMMDANVQIMKIFKDELEKIL